LRGDRWEAPDALDAGAWADCEETFQAGASVSRIARAHDINANQLFHWRKLYREGRQGVEDTPRSLIPVTISTAVRKVQPAPRRKPKTARAGIIDIDLQQMFGLNFTWVRHSSVHLRDAALSCNLA
jgi:hypothetical protein